MSGTVAELPTLKKKIELFQPWYETSPVTLKMMDALVSVFPEQGDVWAKSVKITDNGTITFDAFARNEAAIAALRSRLIATKGVSGVNPEGERGGNPIEFTISFKYDAGQ